MGKNRKLGRKTGARRGMLSGLTTALLVNGSITTTEMRAKEVQKLAEKFITLAVKEHQNFTTKEIKVSKAALDDKGRKVLSTVTSKNGKKYDVVKREVSTKQVQVDNPSRLAARRQMIAFLNKTIDKTGKSVNTVNYLFSDVAPRYLTRNGGYTRVIKLGARRGDGAPMVKLELV